MIKALMRVVTRRRLFLFACAVGSAVLFWEVAERVALGLTAGFDETVGSAIHSFHSQIADVLMRLITNLGSIPVFTVVVIAVAAWAVRQGNRVAAVVLVMSAVSAEGVNLLLKQFFARQRPDLPYSIPRPSSYAFPSGHAMVCLAVYGTLAAVVIRLYPASRPPVLVLTPLVIALIGISRVYLGVHWPTDVVAGFAAGVPFLIAAELSLPRPPKTEPEIR
jgi:membrane-associated phospholipid phosphatase